MRREDIEFYLNRGNELGFVKPTDSPEFLGWVLVRKQTPHERYLSLLAPGEEPVFVAREEAIRSHPYNVQIIELNRKAYESEDYETEEDYRVNESHRFVSLDEVEKFINQFGLVLEEIQWPIDIHSP